MNKSTARKNTLLGVLFVLLAPVALAGHPINDFYKTHKNDADMEAKVLPPKIAAAFIDEDYPEAIDILKSLTALKYLNFYGDRDQIVDYADRAVAAKGDYQPILNHSEGNRNVQVFGKKKKGTVRKAIAVVQTNTQFLLIICKGKLSNNQIEGLPALSKEIQ